MSRLVSLVILIVVVLVSIGTGVRSKGLNDVPRYLDFPDSLGDSDLPACNDKLEFYKWSTTNWNCLWSFIAPIAQGRDPLVVIEVDKPSNVAVYDMKGEKIASGTSPFAIKLFATYGDYYVLLSAYGPYNVRLSPLW